MVATRSVDCDDILISLTTFIIGYSCTFSSFFPAELFSSKSFVFDDVHLCNSLIHTNLLPSSCIVFLYLLYKAPTRELCSSGLLRSKQW